MARDHARIFHRIWRDPDFLALPAGPQRAYLLLLSQESMNYAGVLDLTVGRWARYAPDTNSATVRIALHELEEARFVVVDYDTEEVLVRSFIRADEVYKNVRLLRVAVRHALGAQSPDVRRTLADELARLPRVIVPDEKLRDGKPAAEARACQREVDDAVAALRAAPQLAPAAAPSAAPPSGDGGGVALAPDVAPGPAPSAGGEPAPSAAPLYVRAFGDGDGDGVGDVVADSDLDQNATEADARDAEPIADVVVVGGRIVAGDPDGSHVAITPDGVDDRRGMPPDHCRNHREFRGECAHCIGASDARVLWIAERDAKVAAARDEVTAEIAAETRRRAAQVAACPKCDDDGRLPSGIVCTHDEHADDTLPSGRAAFRAAKLQLEARIAAKKTAESPAPRPPREPLAPVQPIPDDDAPDPVEHDDGSEDLPPGDDAAEDEYRRDQDTWRAYDDGEPIPYAMTGGPDEPPY